MSTYAVLQLLLTNAQKNNRGNTCAAREFWAAGGHTTALEIGSVKPLKFCVLWTASTVSWSGVLLVKEGTTSLAESSQHSAFHHHRTRPRQLLKVSCTRIQFFFGAAVRTPRLVASRHNSMLKLGAWARQQTSYLRTQKRSITCWKAKQQCRHPKAQYAFSSFDVGIVQGLRDHLRCREKRQRRASTWVDLMNLAWT